MNDALIPLAGIALPAILVPTVLAFRHAARRRELHHLERMMALETGQPVPGGPSWPQAFALASIGAGVPLGSFFITGAAWVAWPRPGGEIWLAPSVVSGVALLCSVRLAARLFPSSRTAEAALGGESKPQHNPDAYEMAGR